MAIGLYIHVPFCLKKCSYCDFISYPYDAALAESYVYALEKEMAFYAGNLSGGQRAAKSVYLGGGTPTVLSGDQLAKILRISRSCFNIPDNAEITVECNPGTVDREKLEKLRKAGFNRVSIGVQAYQQNLMSVLGRVHSWQEVLTCVRNSREAGFNNINFDLIFGIPGQTMRDWKETLDRVLELSPQHMSTYNLKIEPDTPLHRDVTSGYLLPCDEELELDMYWYTVDYLTNGGFMHYEISNFALPGREAVHNLIYWRNEEYLGLGPAAHSMVEGCRFNNVKSVETYIRRLQSGETAVDETLSLSQAEQMSESVFLGLRMIEGLDLEAFERRFGRSVFQVFSEQIRALQALGLIETAERHLKLTKKAIPVANEVFAEFI